MCPSVCMYVCSVVRGWLIVSVYRMKITKWIVVSLCVCVCVCVLSMCVYEYVCLSVCVCVCLCVSICLYVCVVSCKADWSSASTEWRLQSESWCCGGMSSWHWHLQLSSTWVAAAAASCWTLISAWLPWECHQIRYIIIIIIIIITLALHKHCTMFCTTSVLSCCTAAVQLMILARYNGVLSLRQSYGRWTSQRSALMH